MWSYFLLICFEWLKRTKPPSDLKQWLLWAKNVHFLSGLHFRDFTKLLFAVWKPKMMITWVHFIAKALLDCIRWNCCEVGFGVCLPRVPGGNLVDVLGRVQDVAVCRGHAVQRKCLLSALVPHVYSYYKYFTFHTPSPTPRPRKKVQFQYVKYKLLFFLWFITISKKNVNLLEVFKVHTFCVFFLTAAAVDQSWRRLPVFLLSFLLGVCVCTCARLCVCVCVVEVIVVWV